MNNPFPYLDLEPVTISRRSPVMGRGGMVASSQPLATAAGLEILSKGGNAADAAVATAAALNVTEPTSTGLGGDMFALYYTAETGQITALNGSGRAPTALTLDLIRKTVGAGLSTPEGYVSAQEGQPQGSPLPELPPYHPYTVTIPGACAGWCDLIERYGTLPLSIILAPAIRLAEEGFPVAPLTSHFWRRAADRQLKSALNGQEMTLDGRGPNPGEIFRNIGLAHTLTRIAEGGKKAYYEGGIAEAIVTTLTEAGGCMTLNDLAAHKSTWDEPISTTYGGLRLWECPPNGQGIAALIALNLLERFDLPSNPQSADRLHLEIEAMRLAFADVRWYVTDPTHVKVPIQELISKSYAAKRSKLINQSVATIDQKRGAPMAGSDTVYFCTVDKWGNACSFINSNYMGFGTGIVPKGWGFTLQNRGHNFNLDPDHPNVLAPGKRPYHTIVPAMITKDQKVENRDLTNSGSLSIHHSLFSAFGVMGGFMQPQGHLQVFLALAQGMDPQSALDMQRFCIEDGTAGGTVALEDGVPESVIADLARRRHPIRKVASWERVLFGRGQVILRDPATGILTGGSDPRADGCAMTLV
jgi:gamma-glutamyltranspeptidase / glutathione hydrolase